MRDDGFLKQAIGCIMEGVWTGVLKYGRITTVAGLVGYTVYPQIIASPCLKNLTHTELFALLSLNTMVVFGFCLALVKTGSSVGASSL